MDLQNESPRFHDISLDEGMGAWHCCFGERRSLRSAHYLSGLSAEEV